jgi:hypothetical protein
MSFPDEKHGLVEWRIYEGQVAPYSILYLSASISGRAKIGVQRARVMQFIRSCVSMGKNHFKNLIWGACLLRWIRRFNGKFIPFFESFLAVFMNNFLCKLLHPRLPKFESFLS